MVLGKKFHFEGEFLDKRHDALYATLSDLQGYSPCLGTHELLLNLKDRGELEAAGGACYVQTIFEGLEPTDEEECL
jgi:replicative DNA helicase